MSHLPNVLPLSVAQQQDQDSLRPGVQVFDSFGKAITIIPLMMGQALWFSRKVVIICSMCSQIQCMYENPKNLVQILNILSVLCLPHIFCFYL